MWSSVSIFFHPVNLISIGTAASESYRDQTMLVAPGYCFVNTASISAGAGVVISLRVIFAESVCGGTLVESNSGLINAESGAGCIITVSVFVGTAIESGTGLLIESIFAGSILDTLVSVGDVVFCITPDVSVADAVVSVEFIGRSVAL